MPRRMEMCSKLINFDVMKKLVVLFLGAALLISAGIAPQREYIEKYSDIAVSEMARTGVPASITLAQGILESNSGKSDLAVNANNHFGIKCHKDWNGLTYRHDDETAQECFRAYATPQESFTAHSDFLRGNTRYDSLFKLKPTDYKAWARGLKECGYATDPKYPQKLIKIIEEYGLDDFDIRKGRPGKADKTSKADKALAVTEQPQPVPTVRNRKVSETILFSLDRPVCYVDGAKCLIALPGETYESIARSCNLFNSEIRKFNSVRKGDTPVPGDFVFVERRPNK